MEAPGGAAGDAEEEVDAQIPRSSGRWVPWWLLWNGGIAWMFTKEIDANCLATSTIESCHGCHGMMEFL